MPLAGGAAGSYLTDRKSLAGKDADVLVRLRPGHGTGESFLILECKVSATRLNSRKRINDCVEKVGPWSTHGRPSSVAKPSPQRSGAVVQPTSSSGRPSNSVRESPPRATGSPVAVSNHSQ